MEEAKNGEEGERGPARRARAEGAEAPQRRRRRCGILGRNTRTCQEDREVSRNPE